MKVVKYLGIVLAVLGLIAGIAFLYFITQEDERLLDRLISSGIIPRIFAWAALITGTYGMIRRRISPLIGVLLMGTSFFFAYLGSFVFPSLY